MAVAGGRRLPGPRPAVAPVAAVPRPLELTRTRGVLTFALALLLVACGGEGGGRAGTEAAPTTTAREPWSSLAARAFEPLASSAGQLPAAARQWRNGALPEAEFRAKVEGALDDAVETRERVLALPPAPPKSLYSAAAALYVEAIRITRATIDIEPGARRDQVALLAARVRQLGDRVFDRGHVLVDPEFGADQPDVVVNLPEEVPHWEAEGMAVGPPFDVVPGAPSATPPLRADARPTGPEAGWLAAVARAGAPAALDLRGDVAAQARAYVAAAEALRAEPDPDTKGGRERSAILRLQYLIKADAARAAQAGLLDVAAAIDAIDVSPDAG